ncbi:MAG: DUF2007 domain-containing protein [Chloroflexi bacterium]|nr:DUF2007 domain-containing protein [Chloroflexota bacterium]
MSSSPAWVYLATAPDRLTAEVWAELLRNDGLPVIVREDYPLTYLGVAFGPCRLMVLEDRLEEAKHLLAEYVSPGEP